MIVPRWYQEEALSALYSFFMTHREGNPLIGLPTGTGKSILPAVFIERVMKQWPNQRFLLLTHVKELIQQNADKMLEVWPEAPLGIYSAGLKSKDTAHPIIFGGIQSMIKRPTAFGHRDIAFVDEAHLVSGDESSQYQTFFALMKLINPNLKIIGMSATLYRMGMGMITENGLFSHVAYDMTNMEGFNKLVAEGYISPLLPLRTKIELDVSNVKVQQGEFVATQLQGAVDKAPITFEALKETVNAGQDRKSWLIFASGIAHAEHIAEQLGAFGVDCAPVHSKRTAEYNDAAIRAFKRNELRSIVNYGKLTTGFDHPEIDLIVMLRPTLSVPLWVQMLGRGTRPEQTIEFNLATTIEQRLRAIANSNKQNCLVLDFARNTPRLGPINDPVMPKMKKGEPGEMPIKICENCGVYNHPKVRLCIACGEEFSFAIKIVEKSGNEELLRVAAVEHTPIIETFNVRYAIYAKHEGRSGKPPTLTATYFTSGLAFKEYVCLQHSGMAGKMARDWWRRRHKQEPPATVDDALKFVSELRAPKTIRVHVNKQYPEILSAEF
jgi:DNA repair protein RadD